MIEYLGLWVLMALFVNMWVLLSVLGSQAGWVARGVWTVVLLVPVLGFVGWFFFGPRRRAG